MSNLRIGHGNGHNERSLVDYVRTTTWDSFGCAEADRLIGALNALPGSRVVVTGMKFDRSTDTPVLVSTDHRLIQHATSKVSRALGRRGSDLNRVAPARVLTEVRYDHPIATGMGLKGVAHLNLHPVAGPRQLNGPNPLAPLTRQYVKAWKAARRAWAKAHADGYLCVLTSDAQMDASSRRPWAPGKQARRMNARAWSTNIDWVLFDPRLALDGVPKRHKLYDHDGFIASFTAARPIKEHR